MSSRKWWAQTPWYIAPVSGSDEAPGTIGAPLKTWGEFRRRMLRAQIPSNLLINQVEDGVDADPIVFDLDMPSTATLTIAGIETTVATLVVTSAVPKSAAANQSNDITVAGFDWSTHVGHFVRVQGTTQYATVLADLGGGTARLDELWDTTTIAIVLAGVTGGQTILVTTRTKAPPRLTTAGYQFNLNVNDLVFDSGSLSTRLHTESVRGAVLYSRCEYRGPSSGALYTLDGAISLNKSVMVGRTFGFFSAGQGPASLGAAGINSTVTFTGAGAGQTPWRSFVGQATTLQVNEGQFLYVKADLGCFGLGAGKIGIDVKNNARVFFENAYWGGGNNGTSVGVNIAKGAVVMRATGAALPTMNAGTNISYNGVSKLWSDLPLPFDVNNLTAFV